MPSASAVHKSGRRRPLARSICSHPVFRAVTTTVAPRAERLDEEGWGALGQIVDSTLKSQPTSLKRQIRLGLWAIQWGSLLQAGSRFTSLDTTGRELFLRSLENHRLQVVRVGFWGIRTLALLGYYGRLEVREQLGYAAHSDGWEMTG
jgi:hypothetical protein